MKKFGVIALTCISMTLTACGSNVETITPDAAATTTAVSSKEQNEETKANETKDNEATEVVKEETPSIEEILKDTPWKLVIDASFEYKCNDALCYNEDTILSVGYAGEIHYYENSDTTWPRAENQSLCRFGLDFIDDNICYTCGNGNITKSVDGGKTFVKKTDFVSKELSTMISFIDENTGIVASKNLLGITKDGAETWSTIELPGKNDIICIKMESADQFCYIDAKLTIYLTEDGGQTWETLPLNLPEGEDYMPVKKSLDIVAEGDGIYTIYCVQRSTKMIKSYTTKDHFTSYTENIMPELAVGASYVHVEGNYLSIYDAKSKTLTAIVKSDSAT